MLKKLRADYENYKSQGFLAQILIATNTSFVVFSLWNIILKPDPVKGLSDNQLMLTVPVLIIGVLLFALLLIEIGKNTHYLLLPASVLLCYLTENRDPLLLIVLIPIVVSLVIIGVDLITAIGNYLIRQ